MDRRSFLQGVALLFAAEAAERVFPFRVFSIPKKIGGTFSLGQLREMAGLPNDGWPVQMEVYSPDFNIHRGSFIVTVDGNYRPIDLPAGIMRGDYLVKAQTWRPVIIGGIEGQEGMGDGRIIQAT
jgi:hypothetical protein